MSYVDPETGDEWRSEGEFVAHKLLIDKKTYENRKRTPAQREEWVNFRKRYEEAK